VGLALTGLALPAGADPARELQVFAAASLRESFTALAATFERSHPGVKVRLNLAGSQELRTQIEQGARADLFASADWRQMDLLFESDAISGQPVDFTSNSLVVVVSSGLDSSITLADLAAPGVRVLIAQPSVPAGAYTRSVLANLQADPSLAPDYAQRVLANVVSEETNVRSVVQKVALGEADAGIVYRTDAQPPDVASKVRVLPIPESRNVIASYPIAMMRDSTRHGLAQKFIAFLISERGQTILEKHGFGSFAREAALPAPGTSLESGNR
jgi:molybdate transport system substrate-binding protein